MLASTTIIKDPVSRKKAKQTRELEIIKRLLKAENPLTEEEREASEFGMINNIKLAYFPNLLSYFCRICSIVSSKATLDSSV